VPGAGASVRAFELFSTVLLAMLVVYMFYGVVGYQKHPLLWPLFLLLTPLAVLFHAIGAAWGLLSPIEEFEGTENVAPDTVEEVNAGLKSGDLADHDGTERLVRHSSNAYDSNIFDD